MSANEKRPSLPQPIATRARRTTALCVLLVAALAGLVLSGACARPEKPAPEAEGAAAPAARTEGASATTPGLAPISTHGNATAAGARVETANARFELPAGWQRVEPSSGMRIAQAVVPGDSGPGELAVFHFGPGMGGSVEANFERWLGQMELAVGAVPERGELTHNGFRTRWIDARGTLLPSTMGSGPASPQPGFRLLGAVVEGEGGPWFFKLTGPEATLAASREPFFDLLRSFRGV